MRGWARDTARPRPLPRIPHRRLIRFVPTRPFLMSDAGRFTVIAYPSLADILEEVDCLPIGLVITNRSISTQHLHVADLTCTVVVENAVFPVIVIAVPFPRFAGEDEDKGLTLRGTDPSLLLASIFFVQLLSPVLLSSHEHWSTSVFNAERLSELSVARSQLK